MALPPFRIPAALRPSWLGPLAVLHAVRRIARERHIAPAVADTCLDRHSRMPDQNEIHASPTR